MFVFEPPDAAAIFESKEGRAVVWFPAPGIAAARCIGYMTGDVARRAYELTDRQAVVPYEGFLDMVEVSGFDWEARGRALKWNILHLSPRMHLNILVVTPPMILATKVFQRALGDHVEFHTDPNTFASAYTFAVKRKTRATTSNPPPR